MDEWQDVPQIWDAARRHIDDNANRKGQLILTGSAIPKDRDAIHHSGTGRIARLRMWPMSLAESGESTGAVSLSDLFEGNSSLPNAIRVSKTSPDGVAVADGPRILS